MGGHHEYVAWDVVGWHCVASVEHHEPVSEADVDDDLRPDAEGAHHDWDLQENVVEGLHVEESLAYLVVRWEVAGPVGNEDHEH